MVFLLLLLFLTPALCCNKYSSNSHYHRNTIVSGGGFRDRFAFGHAYRAGYMDGNEDLTGFYNYPVGYAGPYRAAPYPWVYYAKNPNKGISPLALAASSAKAPVAHADNWSDENCTYEFISDAPLSWYDAEVDCVKRNGSRLSVLADSEAVTRALGVSNAVEPFWIGLVEIEKWGWLWMDGHSPNFTSWALTLEATSLHNVDAGIESAPSLSEETSTLAASIETPEEATPSEEESDAKRLCASMSASNGEWRRENCESQRSYLCQKC